MMRGRWEQEVDRMMRGRRKRRRGRSPSRIYRQKHSFAPDSERKKERREEGWWWWWWW
jgi:hypothetical protein